MSKVYKIDTKAWNRKFREAAPNPLFALRIKPTSESEPLVLKDPEGLQVWFGSAGVSFEYEAGAPIIPLNMRELELIIQLWKEAVKS